MEVKTYVGTIRRAADYVRSRAPSFKPEIGIILGSGLSKAVPPLAAMETIPYSQIPGFPRTTVSGHEGKLILGQYNRRSVAVMQGRFHYYEGHSMESIALPIRMLEYLGLKTLLITSAVGSLRPQIHPGHFVAISDHMNFMGRNPLRAFHEEEFGEMFPDLSEAYDPKLRKISMAICRKHKVQVHEGVYVASGGPSYETPAEIRAYRMLGGDVVGMSVVPEVVVARQMGIRVSALVWIANMAAGMKGATLSHPDVLALGEKVSNNLCAVLQDLIKQS
jgi:purine-nucleoside phosphorylase